MCVHSAVKKASEVRVHSAVKKRPCPQRREEGVRVHSAVKKASVRCPQSGSRHQKNKPRAEELW